MAFIRNVDKLIEGLENKFFTEARAKAALAPELAAEESARQAGDAAEAAARQAADNSLDARLDVIEGSGEGSVAKAEQDAKDYADQKVAALVNSAPAVLDTLKELSDALGGDANFATSVANQIGSVDDKVDQEILDRASAVSAEQSARESADQALDGRLDVLEQDPTTKTYVDGEILDLQGQITQEISDRQAAISSEQSARELADNNLSGRISVLEQDPTTKTYVDGQVSSLDGRLDIIEGADSVEGSVAKAEKDAKDYADSLNSAMDSRVDVLEQDPTTKSYVDGEILDLQGQIDAEQLRAELAEQGLDGRLDILEQDPTTKAYVDQEVSAEESRAISAESALDGRIDVLEQDPTTKTYVDGKVVMLQGEVDSEESRAMQAESALDERLDILEQDPTTKSYVDGEVLDLQGQITQEISDRQSGDSALDIRLDVLEQDPTTKTYVDGIQSALDSRLDVLESDPVTKAYVDGEVSDLQGQVNTEKGRIDAILSAADADKDSFAEIVSLINSVDTSNDNAFASYVLSNDAALAQEVSDRQADVNAEEQRALAAEGLLDGRLDVLESDPTTKTYVDGVKSNLQGQINQEKDDRQAGDNALDARLDIVEGADTVVGSIAKSLKDAKAYADGLNSTEQSARQSADTTLQNNINSEASARSAEDLTLFKKDGSRNLEGNLLFSSETFNIGASAASRPNNVYVKSSIVNAGSESIGTTLTMAGASNANMLWTTDGAGTIGTVSGNRPSVIYAKTGVIVTNGYLQASGNVILAGTSNSSVRWTTDGAGDIGASGANRPNNIYAKTNINLDSLTASRVMISDASKNMSSSSVTSTELGYLSGLSSSAQTQLDSMFKKDGSRVMTGAMDMGNYGINNIGDINMLGGQKVKYSTKASAYTLVAGDYIIAVSDLSASRVMTLPSAATVGAGKVFIIKDQSGAASQTNYIQISPQSGQKIDGQDDYKVVMPYESVMLVSNGSNWFII